MDPAETEVDRVAAWRQLRLEEVGFDEQTAFRLSLLSYVDVHLAARLRSEGCPLYLLAEILS